MRGWDSESEPPARGSALLRVATAPLRAQRLGRAQEMPTLPIGPLPDNEAGKKGVRRLAGRHQSPRERQPWPRPTRRRARSRETAGGEAGAPREGGPVQGLASRHWPASTQASGGGSCHQPSHRPQREHPSPRPAVMGAKLGGSRWRTHPTLGNSAVPHLYLRSPMFYGHLFSFSGIL